MSYCDSNGRVDILGNNVMDRFHLYDKIPVSGGDNYYKTAMTGNWSNNPLSSTFFSKENIQIVQNGIRAGVQNKSNGRFLIAEQDEDTLKMIMRSIYLQHAKNLPNHISEQVQELNQLVFDYAVPQVLGEAIGYVKYKNDSSMMYNVMDRPASTYHNNTLEWKKWF
jgi:hypothetical protein